MKTSKLLSHKLVIVIMGLLMAGTAYGAFTCFPEQGIGEAIFGSAVQRDSPSMPNATGISVATSTLGTMVGTTTLYFKVTSLDYAGGETIESAESSCALGPYLTGAPDGCLVALTPTTGAASTRLWVATTSDTYYAYQTATSSTLVATTTGLTLGTLPQTSSAFLFNSGLDIADTYLYSTATADALIKSGEAIVHSVTFSPTDAAATAGSIHVLDATSTGTGTTTSYYLTAAYHEPYTVVLDAVFDNGLYIDFDTTADVNVTVTYK